MKSEQLQKFYNMAEPRSEEAIRKAEERKTKRKDKELLLQDLCARLPYNVCINDCGTPHRLVNICWDGIKFVVNCSPFGTGHGRIGTPLFDGDVCRVKPYLRPMSSMPEEEREFLNRMALENDLKCIEEEDPQKVFLLRIKHDAEELAYLYEHHYDVNGLIPSGHAIEVTEDNNPYKE